MSGSLNILAFDVGATWLKAALFRPDPFESLRFERVATPDDPAECRRQIESVWQAWGAPARVGLAVAPVLDPDGTVRRWPNRPRFEGAALIPNALRDSAEIATCDDGTAGALSADVGLPGAARVSVFLAVGSGVGGGAVIGGVPLLGCAGSAMDVGHMPVPAAAGAPCTCGRHGCLQAVASGRALERALAEAGLPHRDIFRAAKESDMAAAMLGRASLALAEALTILDRIFDADHYTLGGGLANAALLASMEADAARLGFSGRLGLHPWGERAALAGAALWVLRRTHPPELEAKLEF